MDRLLRPVAESPQLISDHAQVVIVLQKLNGLPEYGQVPTAVVELMRYISK